jgi:membrane-anchored protein YejM (alkaline phosphatase superfamily)
MSKTNHHKRADYEKQYIRLHQEVHQSIPSNLKALSDYQLLNNMNVLLIKKDCIPFTNEELEMELN